VGIVWGGFGGDCMRGACSGHALAHTEAVWLLRESEMGDYARHLGLRMAVLPQEACVSNCGKHPGREENSTRKQCRKFIIT
jgi:hypothetical protein